MLENVQWRATKLVPGLSQLCYEDRLRKLNLPTLAYRRTHGDMIETYKILTNKYVQEVCGFIKLREDHKANYLVGWGRTFVCFLDRRSPQRVVTVESSSLLHHSLSIDFNCCP